jgi:hypothetical protein
VYLYLYRITYLLDPVDQGLKIMNTYSINLVFTTDRALSEQELDLLRYQVIVQIEEPVDGNGDDVDYTTNLLSGGSN